MLRSNVVVAARAHVCGSSNSRWLLKTREEPEEEQEAEFAGDWVAQTVTLSSGLWRHMFNKSRRTTVPGSTSPRL